MSKNTKEPKLSSAYKRRNTKFKLASKAQKRVMIAKDVIKQINEKKFWATRGDWATVRIDKELSKETQACSVLENKDTECSCCALGAMMLSEIRHMDKITIKDLDLDVYFGETTFRVDHGAKGDRLGLYFSEDQIRLIEMAFEFGRGNYYPLISRPDEQRAKDFAFGLGRDYEVADDQENYRLVAIMENIIENKGTFKP
jgi:hypothetical protein